MKKILTTCLFLALSVTLLFAAKPPAYTIKVKINKTRDTICYLGNHYGDKQYIQDTARIDKSGYFVFSGKEKLEGGIYLIISQAKKYFEIIVNDEPLISLETDTLDYIKNMKIKESKENILFYEYLQFINKKQEEVEPLRTQYAKVSNSEGDSAKSLREKMNAIDTEVKNYKIELMKTKSTFLVAKIFKTTYEADIPETPNLSNGRKDSTFAYRWYRAHFFDNVDFNDARLLRTPVLHAKMKQYLEQVVPQHPDSIAEAAAYVTDLAKKGHEDVYKYFCVWITSNYERSNIMGHDAVFVKMVEKYYMTNQAPWVDSTTMYKIKERGVILKPLLLGRVAPNLIMKDSANQWHSIQTTKAEYTILYFWDPDCGHCQKVTPLVKKYYEKVKNKGIQVFAVCTEVEVEKWKKYIRENKLEWINVADPTFQTNFRYIYDISSTPIIYLLNEKKEIVAKKLSIEQVEEMINRLNEEKSKKK